MSKIEGYNPTQYAGMSTSRFFVNYKRISTAVNLNDGSALQVYPIRKRFETLHAWETYWRNSSYASPEVRIHTTIPATKTSKKDEVKSEAWICPACGLGAGNDHRMCICRAFNFSVQAWEEACGICR